MIPLLKSRNPLFSLIFSVVLIVGLRLWYATAEIDLSMWQAGQAPLARFLYNILGESLLSAKWFNYSLSGLVILFLGFYINQLLNTNKILGENNFFMSWIFVLLAHMHPSFIVFSPAMVSLFIIVWVFKDMYEIRHEKKSLGAIFNIGLLYSISFLFWYPSIMLMVLFPIGFFTFNFFNLRVLLVFLVAFIHPFLYMAFYYFWTDDFPSGLLEIFSQFHPALWKIDAFFDWRNAGIFIFLLMVVKGFFDVSNYSQKVLKEVRQFISLVFLYCVLYVMGLFYQHDNTWAILMPLLFPFSIYIYKFLNTIKRRIPAELAHVSLLLSVLFSFIQTL
jgi:hypothetical protein